MQPPQRSTQTNNTQPPQPTNSFLSINQLTVPFLVQSKQSATSTIQYHFWYHQNNQLPVLYLVPSKQFIHSFSSHTMTTTHLRSFTQTTTIPSNHIKIHSKSNHFQIDQNQIKSTKTKIHSFHSFISKQFIHIGFYTPSIFPIHQYTTNSLSEYLSNRTEEMYPC